MRKGVWLGVALLVGIASAGFAAEVLRDEPMPSQQAPNAPRNLNGLIVPREQGPIPGGQTMTLAEAESKADGERDEFVLWRPSHPLANDSTVTVYYGTTPADVSATGTLSQVGLDYSSGLIVIVHRADVDHGFATDAKSQYAEATESKALKGHASLRTILGVPALVIERHESGTAGVDLVLDGMRIKLYALYSDMDAATVIEIAETLHHRTS